MRAILTAAVVGLVAAAAGCGEARTTINTTPLTDEQKRQIQEDDKRIADEESGGTAGKTRTKSGKR